MPPPRGGRGARGLAGAGARRGRLSPGSRCGPRGSRARGGGAKLALVGGGGGQGPSPGGRGTAGRREGVCSACAEDVSGAGASRKGGQSLAGPGETALPIGKVNETLKETRKKKKKQTPIKKPSGFHPVRGAAKGALGRGQGVARMPLAKSLGKGVKAWACWVTLCCSAGRAGSVGDQLFLPTALSSLTIVAKVTAINPHALRVTLCYMAALPKRKRSA